MHTSKGDSCQVHKEDNFTGSGKMHKHSIRQFDYMGLLDHEFAATESVDNRQLHGL